MAIWMRREFNEYEDIYNSAIKEWKWFIFSIDSLHIYFMYICEISQ